MALLAVLGMLLLGMVLSAIVVPAYLLMWGWYVTPVFGVAVPSFGLMWGLLLFVGMLIHRSSKEDEDTNDVIQRLLSLTIGVWLITGIGKLIHVLFV